jgi:glycosyltransferase involved in cell wall biosynthesis
LQPSDDAPSLVSVVVIGYNQQDLAPLAIASVLKQTCEHLECIFVDDGSQDATFERIQAIARTDPRLKAHRKENGGPGSARNYGVARSDPEAEFIAFLDGDDALHPSYVETCLNYLRKNPAVGVVIPSTDFIDGAGAPLEGHPRGYRWVPSKLWILPRRLRDSEHLTPFVTFYCGTGAVPFWFGRFSDYRKTDGWDTTLWFTEDVDMLCQLAMVTEVHTTPDKLVCYRIHPQQATSSGPRTSHRSPVGIGAVQEKWNKRSYADCGKNRILDRACLYYRQVHLPFRALWVARRALLELLRSPSPRSFYRLAELLGCFLRDFFYFKIFFWRSTRRYVATRFSEAVLYARTD